MLFNSFGFLLLFLPVVLIVFFWLGWINRQAAALWLATASLFFYGYWDSRYLPLLGASIFFNYWAGLKISHAAGPRRKHWLFFAVVLDLLLLAGYKYADFLIVSVNGLTHADIALLNIALPVGISFFTFTQIAFLVDAYQGKVKEYRFIHFVLFVSYFPHLIAGPILHHREMMPQFSDPRIYRFSSMNMAIGLSIFVIGLAKKVLIADHVAPLANGAFLPGAQPQLLEAWIGVLAYTCQLYFDFSGYSDMAIGLSRMFGIHLPLNFNSPYKAENISEFWRRWHMTLSRFLRDYLYVPLGGSRSGQGAHYRNLLITMLLGGLWHGAGWTYVAWGALHGFYLMVHHGWKAAMNRFGWHREHRHAWWARIVTFIAVAFAWIFFRAVDFATALDVAGALVGKNGISLPTASQPYARFLTMIGLQPVFDGIRWLDLSSLGMLAGALVLAWFAPNTQQIFQHFEPALDAVDKTAIATRWQPSLRWSVGLALLLCFCMLSLNQASEFLYFQF